MSLDDALLIKPKVYTVCARGHVNEAVSHPIVQFYDGSGTLLEQQVICGRCHYDFMAGSFPAVMMPKEATRAEADDKAGDMFIDASPPVCSVKCGAAGQVPYYPDAPGATERPCFGCGKLTTGRAVAEVAKAS